MSKYYVYQIRGLLERPDKSIGGIRVIVCTATHFDEVDIPSDVFDKEIPAF